MGRVWRGHDPVVDRPVAVKEVLLPPDQRLEVKRHGSTWRDDSAGCGDFLGQVTWYRIYDLDVPGAFREIAFAVDVGNVMHIRHGSSSAHRGTVPS